MSAPARRPVTCDLGSAQGFSIGGVFIRPFSGEALTVTRAYAEAGRLVPLHAHSHEQIVLVETGRLRVSVGCHPPADVVARGIAHFPADVDHEVQVVEDAIFWGGFTPVRDEFMEQAAAGPGGGAEGSVP